MSLIQIFTRILITFGYTCFRLQNYLSVVKHNCFEYYTCGKKTESNVFNLQQTWDCNYVCFILFKFCACTTRRQ